jgi:hypothetical protein
MAPSIYSSCIRFQVENFWLFNSMTLLNFNGFR